MDLENFEERIFGKRFSDLEKQFQRSLAEIEDRHSAWFNNRVDVISNEKPDRLRNHYIFQYNAHYTQFAFQKDSEVPEAIQQECIDVFNMIFNTEKK